MTLREETRTLLFRLGVPAPAHEGGPTPSFLPRTGAQIGALTPETPQSIAAAIDRATNTINNARALPLAQGVVFDIA